MQLHKLSLVKFKISQGTVFKNCKTSAVEKDKGSISHSKQREGQKDTTIFCSINFKFYIFLCCLLQ